MHRCGTSFVAGSLRHLGVSLGDPDRMMRPGGDNPAGYFELQSMMELNDELLAHLGGAWDQPPVLDPGWETAADLDPFRLRGAAVLDDTFGPEAARPPLIGWKDPRLSLLLPFWRTISQIDTTIVLVRDPREVAASLGARKYKVDAPQAASLWMRYVAAAVANDPGCLVVNYRDAFVDLARTLRRIANHLGLPEPVAVAVAAARTDLDPELRHHDASASATPSDPLTAMAVEIWAEGALRLDRLPDAARDALARGWLRPPLDGELLARARSEAVALRETLRNKNRRLAELGIDPSLPR